VVVVVLLVLLVLLMLLMLSGGEGRDDAPTPRLSYVSTRYPADVKAGTWLPHVSFVSASPLIRIMVARGEARAVLLPSVVRASWSVYAISTVGETRWVDDEEEEEEGK